MSAYKHVLGAPQAPVLSRCSKGLCCVDSQGAAQASVDISRPAQAPAAMIQLRLSSGPCFVQVQKRPLSVDSQGTAQASTV
jgi:hypothetical protein